MKAKLYSELEHLTAEQAASYLCYLIDVSETDATDVLLDYANQGVLDFYCEFPHNWHIEVTDETSIVDKGGHNYARPCGYQLHLSGIRLVRVDGEVHARIKNMVSTVNLSGHYFRSDAKLLEIEKDGEWAFEDHHVYHNRYKGGSFKERLLTGAFESPPDVAFLRADIEALATKMNGEPSHQTPEDTQQLQQELEALKAEVERLRAENAELKAAEQKQEKPDDPRQIKNMAKAIYGMAINKYQYNPELQRNTATSVIQRALEKQGIQLDRDTIKRYIDTGKEAFEEDGK